MKFCLYTSTPGLERFPESERFAVWCSTHKRLRQEDTEYRQSVRRFRSKVIWTTVLFTMITLFSASNTVLSAIRGRPAIILNVICLGVLSLGYTIYIIVAAFRM